MTERRESGWVAGRYLTRAGARPPHRVIGVLGNGTEVRSLGCQPQGAARWCRIEMMTDMRERGWVNARFLAEPDGQAAAQPGRSRSQRIRFRPGTSGTEFPDSLSPGARVSYVLGAQNGQMLTVELPGAGAGLVYRIVNPDGSPLLEDMRASQVYRGQLWQSGDHRIEVINRGDRTEAYNVLLGIR